VHFLAKTLRYLDRSGSSASTAIRNSVAPVAIHYPPFPETLLDLQVLDP
jgi:hypothetical protein